MLSNAWLLKCELTIIGGLCQIQKIRQPKTKTYLKMEEKSLEMEGYFTEMSLSQNMQLC